MESLKIWVKYMKEIFRLLKSDFRYIFKSKILLICLIIVPFFYAINFTRTSSSSLTEDFSALVENYKYNDNDIKRIAHASYDELNNEKEYQVKKMYEEVNEYYQQDLEPNDYGRLFVNSGWFVFGLIIIAIVFCLGNDYHYKTINIFASKTNWAKRMLVKVSSTFAFSFLIVMYSYLLSHVFSYILNVRHSNKIPDMFKVDFNKISHVNVASYIMSSLLINLLLILVFALILIIFRNRIYLLCIALIYLLLPPIELFDLRGIIEKVRESSIIDQMEGLTMFNTPLDINACYSLIISVIFICIPLIIIAANKRSRFID